MKWKVTVEFLSLEPRKNSLLLLLSILQDDIKFPIVTTNESWILWKFRTILLLWIAELYANAFKGSWRFVVNSWKKRQSSCNLVSDQREEERSCLFSSVPPTAARERNLNWVIYITIAHAVVKAFGCVTSSEITQGFPNVSTRSYP